jgi:hypothetical protein
MSEITDTQPLARPVEPSRRSFDYRRGTRALQVTAACLGLAVVGGGLGVILTQPGPTVSQTTEPLTPLGTVTPETTTTAVAEVTSTASTPPSVVQSARATTVWRAPIQPYRPAPVITSTTPPPQVVIAPPVKPTVEPTVPTTTRSRRAAPPQRAPQSSTREPQEPYEPQGPPLIDIGGLLP